MVQEFQARIVTASQNDLVVINYEMLLAELDEAVEFFGSEDLSAFSRSMKKAGKMLNELSYNLDFKYDISRDLMSLYIFVNRKIIEASQSTSVEPIFSAQAVLNSLLVGWKEAAREMVQDVPLIQNGQQLYAGLTYGKKHLNETVYNEGSRGFKA